MPFLIDAHLDLAYNMLVFNRDYRRSVAQTRVLEKNTPVPERNGEALVGWEELQRGQVGLVVGTLYVSPHTSAKEWDTQQYRDRNTARKLHLAQVAAYGRLCDQSPELFRLVRTREDLTAVLDDWQTPAEYPDRTHPVGIILSMEGAEGLPHLQDLTEWRERGLRLLGPVWGGGRYCGAAWGKDLTLGFDREGHVLLTLMAELGIALDLSHMNHVSMRQAIDFYPGEVLYASHLACESVYGAQWQRLITDESITALVERDGVVGLVPANYFLRSDFGRNDPRENVSLSSLADHVDHVCQLAGSAAHVALGTDFDGGFGLSVIPKELNSIADLQLLAGVLKNRGYNESDISLIFHGNWQRLLLKIFDD